MLARFIISMNCCSSAFFALSRASTSMNSSVTSSPLIVSSQDAAGAGLDLSDCFSEFVCGHADGHLDDVPHANARVDAALLRRYNETAF